MYLRKIASFSLTMALLSSVGFGQAVTAPTPVPLTAEQKAEKAKKDKEIREQIVTMLDQTVADINALRLPGNRAVVYALAGDIYWRYDSKRARELFRAGSNELLNYQADAERERLDNVGQNIMPDMFDPSDPRYDFLNLVGGRDPELGLELMAQTRPPAIADAMAKIAQQAAVVPGTQNTSSASGSAVGAAPVVGTFDPDRARATQEIALEQSLTIRAAATDPEKAAKAIKESLAKGISFSVQPLLQIILQKDEKRATDLAADVVGKLTGSDLLKNSDDLNGALSYLQFMARPPQQAPPGSKFKIFTFSDAQAKEVGYSVASALLKPSLPTFANGAIARALPSLEKLVPERAAALKQKDAQAKKAATGSAASSAPKPQQPTRSWDPNDTPEQIIAAANKIANARDKTAALQSAANKIGQIADEARAKKIIESIPDEKIRAMAQDRFDANRINRMTVEGRLDEAKASVATLTNKRTQIQRLVSLALQYQRKNTPKDLETAGGLMTEAKTLTNQFPEDEDELADYMELVRGYAVVEPDVAFRMMEPMMDQFNEMVQATAVLMRYNKRDRTFKKGELVMRIGGGMNGMLAFRYVPQIQSLARADLDRANTMTDRFQRSDARTLMKLYVLQGYTRGY